MTTSPERSCSRVLRNPIHFFALGFGSGCIPTAPGTFGTLAAVPLYWLVQHFSLPAFVLITVLMFVFGVWVCGRTSQDLGVHDHQSIVWDEVVGYFVTMINAPAGLLWMVLGFGLFRLFDIFKPWPIAVVDAQVKGGLGIMLDDVLAGIYAFLVLQGIAWWLA